MIGKIFLLSSSSLALLVRRLKVFWRAETLRAALKPHRDVVPCHKPCELSYHFLIWLTLISVSNIESGPVLVELLHVNAIQRNCTKKSLRWLVCCHILPPLCVPSCSSPPHSCLPWLCRFSIRPVLWQSCFLQRMCVVRNHWCKPQLKTPELCSGGSSLAEVVSLGMGVGKWAGSFDTSLLDEAAVRTCWWHQGPGHASQGMRGKVSCCIQTHPQKSTVRIPHLGCWLACLRFWVQMLAVCHLFVITFLGTFVSTASTLTKQVQLSPSWFWVEGIAGRCFRTAQRDTHSSLWAA